MPWYYQGTNLIPTYMTRYSIYFVEDDVDYDLLLRKAVIGDKSYSDDDIEFPIYDVYTQKIPRGANAGSLQKVYYDHEASYKKIHVETLVDWDGD